MQLPPASEEMSAFKHVVVPLGVVIGLGVVHIVTSLSKYLDNRKSVRFCFGHGVWTAITLIWFIGLWWMLWQYRAVGVERWSFFSLILLLAGPAILYLAVSLLLPSTQFGQPLDLGARFDQIRRPFFLCLCATVIWLATCEVLLLREAFDDPRRIGQGVVAVLMALGATFPSRRFAGTLGVVVLILAAITFMTFRSGLA